MNLYINYPKKKPQTILSLYVSGLKHRTKYKLSNSSWLCGFVIPTPLRQGIMEPISILCGDPALRKLQGAIS